MLLLNQGDSIQQYLLKRGYKPEIERIKQILEENFPVHLDEKEGKLALSYGALKHFEAWIAGKELYVDTVANPEASEEQILDTNKRFRKFLDEATGYSSKQRVKMAKKEVVS
jgi:hypothetical protein